MASARDKPALRARAHAARAAIASEARTEASRLACANLVALPELTDVRIVLGYAAMPDEIDPAAALEHLRARGVRIAYPRVESETGVSLRACDPGTLSCGAYRIPEPPSDAETVCAGEVDAVIVPGLAFDSECRRLGRGAGHYDRMLVNVRADAPLIGLAFDEQIVERLPEETHDVPMDAVVTPSTVYRRP